MPDVVHDPTFGVPDARRIVEDLAGGAYQNVRDLLASTADPDQRSFYVDAAAEAPGRPQWCDTWVRAEPRSAEAHLLRGAHGVKWAWEARGGLRAEYTEKDQFKLFFERLAVADEDLRKAAELAPADPEPWAHLVTCARGLQLGAEELGRRFKEVVTRRPWHRLAHSQMLQGVAAKWSGSHTLMFNFARERALAAPEGGPIAVLIAEAHIEGWLDCETAAEEDAYFRHPDVLAELHAAADRSVRSPHWRPRPYDVRANNLFAFAFALGGDLRAAAEQFTAIGGRITESPWHYLAGKTEDNYRSHRDRTFESLR